MQVVDFCGGRSRTRTYDLSHVSLRHIAKVEQTLLENPKQTISSAVESLPSFARFRQLHTDKGRHSSKFSSASPRADFYHRKTSSWIEV